MSEYPVPHYLRPTTSDRLPQRVIAVSVSHTSPQIDTDHAVSRMVLLDWSAVYWRWERGRVTRRTEAVGSMAAYFWEWMYQRLRPGTLTWIFSEHALTTATLLGVWDELEGKRLTLDKGFVVLDDPPFILNCQGGGKIEWVDLRNYGINSCGTSSDSISHARRVENTVMSMCDSLRANSLGSLRVTASAQSLYTFCRKYLEEKILVHGCEQAYRLERGAYSGGRCECFRLGRTDGPIYRLDVNSMYGYAALGARLPVRLVKVYDGGTVDDLKRWQEKKTCIARVDVECPEPGIPCRVAGGEEKDGRLRPSNSPSPLDHPHGLTIYPVGKWTATLCGRELERALALDLVQRVHMVAVYDFGSPFDVYVQDLHRLRYNDNGDQPDVLLGMWKSMLVGIWGKLAQRRNIWRQDPEGNSPYPYYLAYTQGPPGAGLLRWRVIGWQCEQEEIGGEVDNALPQISAVVNANARNYLRILLEVAGHGNAYYCDTDSLWVNAVGFNSLCDAGYMGQHEIGKLKVEAVYDWVDFRGIRYYDATGVVTRAGMSSGATADASGNYTVPVPAGVDACLSQGSPPQPVVTRQTFRRNTPYRHGVPMIDGSVRPFEVDLWLTPS